MTARCPLCGKEMERRRMVTSPAMTCSCGHAEGFVYPKHVGVAREVK